MTELKSSRVNTKGYSTSQNLSKWSATRCSVWNFRVHQLTLSSAQTIYFAVQDTPCSSCIETNPKGNESPILFLSCIKWFAMSKYLAWSLAKTGFPVCPVAQSINAARNEKPMSIVLKSFCSDIPFTTAKMKAPFSRLDLSLDEKFYWRLKRRTFCLYLIYILLHLVRSWFLNKKILARCFCPQWVHLRVRW